VVTSGDYQRAYMVDGNLYHHIIDPDTLYPSRYWRSVSILCSDSGLADALSTALFLLPMEEGQALLDKCGAEALWVDAEGALYYSPGFRQHIRT
jgi:thiamine biosynthesis lipoprotein